MSTDAPALSVVVVTFEQDRELPRTLRSLDVPYQRGIDPGTLEIVVVDNGSPQPVSVRPNDGGAAVRVIRLDDAAVSPAHAANVGLEQATGEVVGLVIDGARLASPGLLRTALLGHRLSPRAVVTAPAWHLGPDLQRRSSTAGYDQSAEDELLASVAWEDDGYRLFEVSAPAASSARGLFGPMGESSSLFLRRALWDELGGLDERFVLPGGGLVNHDLYRRACDLPEAPLVVLLGEGTFHQIHGGAATSVRVTSDEMRAEYEGICGEPHRPPGRQPTFVGSVPPAYRPHLAHSVALADARYARTPTVEPEGGSEP